MVKIIIIIESLLASLASIFFLPNAYYFWVPIVVFLGGYVVFTLIYLLILYCLGFFVKNKQYDTQSKLYNFAVVYTCEWLLNIFHAKIITKGLDKVPHNEKYMLVYNHTSNFDPIIESWILRKDNVIHISKPGNFKKPIAGKAIRRNCYIEINRENAFEAIKSIQKATEFISDQKYCIGVAPEGTRNKGDVHKLLPFRDGCFKIALYSKCPIVIVELYNAEKIAKNAPFKRTKVEMNVLDVLYYDDYKDYKTHEIGDIVKNKLQNAINERI